MFPATMIHRSGAARVRVNSQEEMTRLGSYWQLEAPSVAAVEAAEEVAPVVVPAPESRKRGRPRKQ